MPYYDRKTDDDDVLCDPCGAAAWPEWPLVIHRQRGPVRSLVLTGEPAAFERRIADPSGDYCWTPVWSAPFEATTCAGCNSDVDARKVGP